jgi:hypothetical protein
MDFQVSRRIGIANVMPALSQDEKRAAAAYVLSQPERKRVSESAMTVAAAMRRILDGYYGSFTPDNQRIKEASQDLGLTKRQKTDLRAELRVAEADFVRPHTLDKLFAEVEHGNGKRLAASVASSLLASFISSAGTVIFSSANNSAALLAF